MVLAAVFLATFGAWECLGKAAYYGPDWMITNADYIAVVNITRVITNVTAGKFWTYREMADATVETVVKGALPPSIKLHAGEDFICAQVRYQPGRRLVFLKKDGELLAGVNWHLGNRPIVNGRVEWFADSQKNVHVHQWLPLETVVEQIHKRLAQ